MSRPTPERASGAPATPSRRLDRHRPDPVAPRRPRWLAAAIDPLTILDEIGRLGYEGTQLDDGLPEGAELRATLAARASGSPRSTRRCPPARRASARTHWRSGANGCGSSSRAKATSCASPSMGRRIAMRSGPGRQRRHAAAQRRRLARAGREPPHPRRRDDRGWSPPGLPPACRDVRRDAGRGRPPRHIDGPRSRRDLSRRRALHRRRRRPCARPPAARRARHARPPQGRRSDRPGPVVRRDVVRPGRGGRRTDLHRARRGQSRSHRASCASSTGAATTAG